MKQRKRLSLISAGICSLLALLPISASGSMPSNELVTDTPRLQESKETLLVNVARPFPQHTDYVSGSIKPNHVSQAELDNDVRRIYDEWKERYIKKHPKASNQYYVFYNLEKTVEPDNAVSSSEGHGYGMLATVLMAGHDAEAKTYFDGLYRYYKAHPSVINSALMAWQQVKDSKGNIIDNPDGGNDAATDGDMDIAYALLLADKQWGSSGEINYLSQAKNVINAIMKNEVNYSEGILKLGDWADDSDSKYGKATRTSDFMLSHLKAFEKATGNSKWSKVVDKTYSIQNTLYTKNSSKAGLLPDFAVKKSSSYVPAPPHLLEDKNDGNYYYNACRVPWRLPVDYLMSGDSRAVPQLETLNAWIQKTTSKNPKKVMSGYSLDGKVLPKADFNSMAFTAPFAVSAMIDSQNQEWLNKLWAHMASSPTKSNEYFDNSIRLLTMITASGNWWLPE
ncbi:beta-glucanase [Brevibacillus sp. SKDU10]|uniref:glycosyl hydrolase family 8 n=1 Tax=Brevibacillus sp. SKDU10 TaxID=1247872 RepID=UPI0007C8EC1F|nr:glycosyl hydrolase family 8 [Brevibacillus sp. SKDU10]OAJ74573.1 beta-glucanase [Brevibacillus sp. SKDU10]